MPFRTYTKQLEKFIDQWEIARMLRLFKKRQNSPVVQAMVEAFSTDPIVTHGLKNFGISCLGVNFNDKILLARWHSGGIIDGSEAGISYGDKEYFCTEYEAKQIIRAAKKRANALLHETAEELSRELNLDSQQSTLTNSHNQH